MDKYVYYFFAVHRSLTCTTYNMHSDVAQHLTYAKTSSPLATVHDQLGTGYRSVLNTSLRSSLSRCSSLMSKIL